MSAFSILTIIFLLCSLKSAASKEYYIVPSDLNDSLVDPQLTLSQFAANSMHYLNSNTTTVTLFIEPGLHILSSHLIVEDVDAFSMFSNESESTPQIVCDESTLYFRCKDLHISNIDFIGCETVKFMIPRDFYLKM